MACQIYRNEDGTISKVTAPNGNESKLYKDILALTTNEEEAVRLWAQVYTPSFKTWFGDWELLERAKPLKDNIKGFYKEIATNENMEQVLFEASIQTHSSKEEARVAMEIFKEGLIDIAVTLFPNAKVGDKFESKISKVVDKNGEPLIVYHATNDRFDEFKEEKTTMGSFFFTDNKKEYSIGWNGKSVPVGPYFLSIKNPFIGDYDKSIGVNSEDVMWGGGHYISKEIKTDLKSKNIDGLVPGYTFSEYHVALDSNQIKSVFNDGNFAKDTDNIYKAKPKDLSKDLMRYLQFSNIVDSNNEISQDKLRNTERINQLNDSIGYEALIVEKDGKVKTQLREGDNIEIKNILKENSEDNYKDYITNKLYPTDSPVTTDLLFNAVQMAESIGRQDLVNVGKFVYQFLDKNPGLTVQVDKDFTKSRFLKGQDSSKTLGYYLASLNSIHLNLDSLSKASVETNVETIMEEFLHSVSAHPFFKDGTLTDAEKEYKGKINDLFNYYKSKSNKVGDYRFTNPEEFIIGITMDPDFKNHLYDIENKLAEPGLLQRIINWFLRAFSNLIGIKSDTESMRKASLSDNLDLLRNYLTNVDRVNNDNYLKEKGRNYDLIFPSITRGNISEKKISDSIETFRKNIDQMRRTGIVNKLTEVQKIAIEDVRRQLNSITEDDINKMALFTDYLNDLNNVIKTNLNQVKQIELSETLDPDQKLAALHTVMATTKAFDLSIDSISKLKRFIEDSDTGLHSTVDSLLSNRTAISSIYNDIILPIVLDKYDNIFEHSVLTNTMTLDKELNFKREKLTKYQTKGDRGMINVLTKEINEIVNKKKALLPTRERIENLLTGKAKDSNFVSMYLEAWAFSEDPTVSGLVDYVKRQFNKSAVSLQSMGNQFQTELNSFLKDTGKTINNPEQLHEDLIETVKQVDNYDGENFTYKEKLTLVNEYNKDYIKDAQEFIYRLNSLQEKLRATRDTEHRTGIIDKLRALRKEQRQWEKDFMERPYTDFYYKVFETLHEDLGGFTAAEALHDIDEKLYQTEKAIKVTEDPNTLDDLFNQKDDILKERKRLYSKYNKPEGTKERKIADQLTKYKEESRKLADYKLTSKGLAKFNRDLEKLNDRFKSGQISDAEYKRWMDDNTVQESFTDEFWKKYNQALTNLSDILEKLGVQKDKNIADIYAEIRNLGNIYRNQDGIIEGEEVKKDEAAHIKSLQEKVEELKEKAEDAFGLTKQEKKRYYELSHIANDPYMSDDEWSKYQQEYVQLANKKKKADRSLTKQYYEALAEINKLSESIPTTNYYEEYQKQLDKFAAELEAKPIPLKFNTEDEVYTKKGNSWFDSKGQEATNPEYLYRLSRAEFSFQDSEWFKDNHYKKQKFFPSDTGTGGEMLDVDEPIYIWKKMEPKDKGYIDRTPKAGFKYMERIVKDEYVNKHYRESVDGYNQPRLSGAKDNRYVNAKYQSMVRSNDTKQKATAKYLKFLSQVHIDNQKHLPQSQRIGYFLPSIRKDWIESIQAGDYTAKSIYEKLGELIHRAKEKVVLNEQDKDTMFGYVSSDNDMLPVRMTGDIDIKDQSRDATKAIMMFAANNQDYKNLNESLPFINAVRDILANEENNPLVADTKGNVIKRTIKGKFFGVKKAASNRARLIDEVYRTYYLGERRKNEAAAKVIDTTLGYAAKMMLGLNPTSLISNFANAEIQKVLVTGMDGFFTAKQYGRSYYIFSSIIPDLIKDATKVGNKSLHNQIIDHFGGINSEFRTHFAKDLKYTQLRNSVAAFMMPTSLAETEIANTVFIAIALNFKVKQGNDFISLYDAFELDDNKNLKKKEGVVIDDETEARFKRRLTAGLRKINGNYNSLDNTLAEKYTAGRMIFFMNKFYVPFFSNRWSGQRYDFETDTITKGYYRVFLQRFLGDIKNFNFNMIANWSTMSSEQRTAYKRVGIEVLVSAICIGLIGALGGQDPQDLKKNGLFNNNLIYQLNIIRSQNESFIPFPSLGLNEMINRIKNPFPLMTKITNAGKLVQDTFLATIYPLGLSEEKDVFYTTKSGWHNPGDSKVMADLDRLFGVFYRFKNIMHPEVAIRNFQNTQRIK